MVADDAFALKPYLMKPYAFRNQIMANRVFNYRLSRARRIIENVFGIAAARFRILRRPIDLTVENTVNVVLAVCVLHNFLVTRNGLTRNDVDQEGADGEIEEGTWRAILRQENNFRNIDSHNTRYTDDATEVRETFTNYFSRPEGEVEWQYRSVLRGTQTTTAQNNN